MRPLNEITGEIVDAAFRLHSRLGPGLLENVYEHVLAQALEARGMKVERQKSITFEFDGIRFEDGLKLDLLVDDCVIVELKSVEKLAPVHAKQLLTYLRVLDLRVGLLLNFGAPTMREGLKRVINSYRPTDVQKAITQSRGSTE